MAFLSALLFGLQTTYGQHETDIILGSEFAINSSILNEDRTCLISLPDSYNDSSEVEKKYPIIILLDGYTHFNTATGIVHFMSSNRNRNHLMPETIIIAIENVDRERDFTVTKIKTKRPNTMGGGRNFLNFIEKELKSHNSAELISICSIKNRPTLSYSFPKPDFCCLFEFNKSLAF